jgi:hypothetical protein
MSHFNVQFQAQTAHGKISEAADREYQPTEKTAESLQPWNFTAEPGISVENWNWLPGLDSNQRPFD